MPKFVTIGYGDREGYDRIPPAIRDAAHAHDAKLWEHGVLMGIAGAPVQVRNHQAGRVQTSEGPFMALAIPVGEERHDPGGAKDCGGFFSRTRPSRSSRRGQSPRRLLRYASEWQISCPFCHSGRRAHR